MAIQIFDALSFTKFMGSGRTRPFLCSCKNKSLVEDFVIKSAGNGQSHTSWGCIVELISSQLATYFEISTPDFVLVNISEEFINAFVQYHANNDEIKIIKNSLGLNFGSKLIKNTSQVLTADINQATKIFAFDALIQNFDRRAINNNLFIKNKEVIVYDHELAFSSYSPVALFVGDDSPLDFSKFESLVKGHIFYTELKSKKVNLSKFQNLLSNLTDDKVNSIISTIPQDWLKNVSFDKILKLLQILRNCNKMLINL